MDWFRGVKNWFQGAFSDDDDEEKKRREAEARRRAAQNKPKTVQNVNQLFVKPQPNQNPKLVVNKTPEQPKLKVEPTPAAPRIKVATPYSADLFKQTKPAPTIVERAMGAGTGLREAPGEFVRGVVGASKGVGRVARDIGVGLARAGKAIATNEIGKQQGEIAAALEEVNKSSDQVIQALKRGEISSEDAKNMIAQIDKEYRDPLNEALKSIGSGDDRRSNVAKLWSGAKNLVVETAKDVQQPFTTPEAQAKRYEETTGKKPISKEELYQYGLGLSALGLVDLFTGGGKKKLAAELAEATTTEAVTKALGKRGLIATDDILEKLRVLKDKNQISGIVDELAMSPQVRQQLDEVVKDPNEPAFRRKDAQVQIDKIRAADEATELARPANIPALQAADEIQRVIDNEKDNFTRFINENRELTPDQIARAAEASAVRTARLVDELKAKRAETIGVVDEQGAAIEAAQDAQKATNAEVAANQAAKTTPPPGEVVQTPPAATSPEVVANDAYRGRTDTDVLFEGAPTVTEKGRLSIPQLFSPDRVIRENITRPTERAVNRVIAAAQTSPNPISRMLGRLFTGVSREAGATPELLAQRRLLRGGTETGKLYRDTIDKLGKDLTPESKQRVFSTLDPERADELGMKVADDLTPEELVYQTKLKEVIDFTTAEHLRRGNITPAQAANGDYIKRGYTIFEDTSDMNKAYTESRAGLLNQFKERGADISEEVLAKAITDPGYLVAKKTAESHAMWAMQDFGGYLVKSKLASDIARPGYVQLPDSKIFGRASGKFVPRGIAEDFTGFQYSVGMLNSFNDLISAYDSLGFRRAKKQLLTVFNPAVRVGNQFSNRVVFANMNGINPVQFNAVYSQVRNMKKQGHQLYREAVEQGLTGIDITQADFARRISEYTQDPNIGKRAIQWFQKSYSEADDSARVAAYSVHRSRGLSPADAATETQRGFQDYNSVGFFYDMAAKTPLIGNAFVRFAADAIRIAKNAAIDHPLRTAATIAMWVQFTNMMSDLSDESEEDRITREGRFGAPKIPFTDISLTVQTPFGEINAARFLPFYALNDIGSEAMRFLPIQQNPLTPQGWQDPLLGQVGQALTDTDFRGKSIRDPKNETFADNTTKYDRDPLSDDEKRANLLRFLFTQNAPIGREIDSVRSALKGEEDIYGKTRSPWQSLFRAGGIKVEQFGKEQAEEKRGEEAYHARKAEIEAEVAGMSPEAQAAYRRLTGQYNLREQKPNTFKPGETVDKNAPIYDWSEQKWGEYQQHPELFDLMEKRANREAQANGAPLHPLFDKRLPQDFRYQLAQQKSIAPGDDLELQQRLYEDPRWDYYQAINDEYRAKAKEYYPDDGNDDFVDEMVKHQDAKFPTKPPLWQQYLDARNRGVKPEWNDAFAAARTEWENAKLNWTNRERAVRGLPAIPAEQWFNSTFGYDPDADKGFGFGGGSNRPYQTDMLGNLTNFTAGVDRYDPIKAQELPNIAQLFARLRAGSGGGKRKPTLGAASRGQI